MQFVFGIGIKQNEIACKTYTRKRERLLSISMTKERNHFLSMDSVRQNEKEKKKQKKNCVDVQEMHESSAGDELIYFLVHELIYRPKNYCFISRKELCNKTAILMTSHYLNHRSIKCFALEP